MLIKFKEKKPNERYALMVQSIIPRPIAWVMTEDKEVLNIAPFSYFAPLSSEPPTLIVSIGHRPDGSQKDTLRNIRKSKKCVVCLVDDVHFERMHFSSKNLAKNESEIDVFNIKTESILDDFPPIPKDIKVAYFCEYSQEVNLKGSKTIPLVLEIQHLYLDETIISDKEKMYLNFSSIARVGRGYASLQDNINTPKIP